MQPRTNSFESALFGDVEQFGFAVGAAEPVPAVGGASEANVGVLVFFGDLLVGGLASEAGEDARRSRRPVDQV